MSNTKSEVKTDTQHQQSTKISGQQPQPQQQQQQQQLPPEQPPHLAQQKQQEQHPERFPHELLRQQGPLQVQQPLSATGGIPFQTGKDTLINTSISTLVSGLGVQQPQGIQGQQQQGGAIPQEACVNEPTINLFNNFVAKDTHCLLGRTGVKISRVTLGSMNFGSIDPKFGRRPGQLSEDDAHKILDRFLELGGNCIDTADFFPWFGNDVGVTETIIGNWLQKQVRQRVFLITKVRMPIHTNNINSIGLSRCNLFNSINESLVRLKTTWIDMLVLNGWDNTVSFGDTARNLNDLLQWDKIRYIGVCDFKGWQLQKLIDAAKILNINRPVCYMGEYNLLTRGCELEVLEVCKNERIAFIAYSPLKYGFLTDETIQNYNVSAVPNSRIEAATQNNLAAMAESIETLRRNPVNMNVLNACHFLSRKYKVSVQKIAIQWLLQTGVVTSVCVGVEDTKELDEIMSCLVGDFVLSQEDMEELNFVSTVQVHYPYHTQFSEIAGIRKVCPIKNKTEFEQLGFHLDPNAKELDTDVSGGLRRMQLRETVHESLNQVYPERDFMRYMQMKTPSESTQFQQMPSVVSSVNTEQRQLGEQGKIIQ